MTGHEAIPILSAKFRCGCNYILEIFPVSPGEEFVTCPKCGSTWHIIPVKSRYDAIDRTTEAKPIFSNGIIIERVTEQEADIE